MAKQEERREATKRNLLAASSAAFRSRGFAGVGVDGISQAAGATSGAFYAHLGSKQRAFKLALESGLDEVIEAVPKFQSDHGIQWVDAFVRYYLGSAHREDLACGCAMTTLSPEVVREDLEIKEIYESKMHQIVDLIAEGLDGGNVSSRRARAWSLIATLVGGLTLCRALATEKEADAVSLTIAKAANAVAGVL